MRKKKSFWKQVVRYKALILMTIPGLIVLIVNNYMPMFGLSMAFKSMDYSLGFFKSPFVGLDNFEFVFKANNMGRIIRNTLLYNLFFITASLPLNAGLAILITELKSRRMAKLYQTIYVMPYFISMVIIAVIAYAFLGTSSGYINSVLQSVGADKIQWYSEAKYWPIILIIVYYWKQNGYGAIIYIATITGFDQNIFEAAMIDGASRWQKIRYLTIPMLKQTMVVLTIVSLGGIFKGNFGLFYNVPMDAPTLYPATDVIDTYIYRALSTMPNIGMTTAASFVQSVAGCVTVVVANLIIRKIDKESSLF